MASFADMHTLTKYFEEYAETGSETVLHRLRDEFWARASTHTMINGAIDGSVMRTCIIRLMETSIASNFACPASYCLRMLCSGKFSEGARVVLLEIPSYPDHLYERLILRIRTVILNSVERCEIGNSFKCLAEFGNGSLGTALRANDEILRAVWTFMDTRFVRVGPEVQTAALQAASAVIKQPFGSSEETYWPSIRARALPILVKLVLDLSEKPTDLEKTMCMELCKYLSMFIHAANILRPDQRADIEESVYKLSGYDPLRFTMLLSDLLNTAATTTAAHTTALLCINFAAHLPAFYGFDMLRAFLLYKQPHCADAKHMVVLMKETVLRSEVAALEHKMDALISALTGKIQGVRIEGLAEVLSTFTKPASPARSDKDRRCACPGCPVDGQGYVSDMKKCGRCKSVYYCCEGHQKSHWPEHRKVCKAKVT